MAFCKSYRELALSLPHTHAQALTRALVSPTIPGSHPFSCCNRVAPAFLFELRDLLIQFACPLCRIYGSCIAWDRGMVTKGCSMVFLLLILQAFMLWALGRCTASLNVQCPQAIFSFGDSLSDTGNAVAAFPGTRPVEAFPYGQTYFHHPAKRYSDGRLVIDFIAQAFGFPFLAPYLQTIESDYRHGVNFANSGATARSTTIVSPFPLQTQVNQFISFKKEALALQNTSSGQPWLPAADSFPSALYVLSIGFNDFWQNWKVNHVAFPQLEANVIPEAVQSIVAAVQELYAVADARNFVVVNVPAMGCIPQVLSSFGNSNSNSYGPDGCLIHHNNLVSLFNGQLQTAVATLRQQLPDATLFTFDYYAFHKDSVKNPQDHGFYQDTTLVACCGGGGKYNDPGQSCGPSTKNVCLDPSAYISWDGLHFTEGFNRLMAQALLTGKFIDSAYDLSTLCYLDFSTF